jgi:hypothetical protein
MFRRHTVTALAADRRTLVHRRQKAGHDGSSRGFAVRCRELTGRRPALTVFLDTGHVVLVPAHGDAAVLSPLDAGWLRAALRDTALARRAARDVSPEIG